MAHNDDERAEAVGRAAYEIYCRSTGGRSAVTHDPLPSWLDAREDIRLAWMRAGVAAVWAWTAHDLQRAGVEVPPLRLPDEPSPPRWT